MQRNSGATPAVVVGLDCITGLQTARILAGRGVPVVGVASDKRHACARTRAPDRVVEAPTHGGGLLDALDGLKETLPGGAVLVPCTDAAVLSLARGRDQLDGGYRLLLPETPVVEMLMDKLRFYEFAEQHGLPVPVTRVVRSREEVESAVQELTFPCILKPTLKTPLWEQNSSAKVHRAESEADLLALYERYAPFAEALMVQQWIDGPDSELYSCNCYYDGVSTPLVTFVARKLRQWPPRMGTSSLGEECRNDMVLELTRRTFGAAGYRGLGYLEVKRDARTGRHYIIEANVGRPTGRSAIAEAGGVELLHTMYCDALGLPLPSARDQQYTGAKWIYWRQDLRSALYYWRAGELSLKEWASTWRGRKATAVFSWSDPVPFLADLASIPSRLVAHRRGSETASSPGTEGDSTDAEIRTVPSAGANGSSSRGSETPRPVDFDLAGVMLVRVIGATSADLTAVGRQLGGMDPAGSAEPDVVLRFVDRLARRGLRHVEVGKSGFTEDGYMIRAPGSGSPWVRIPFADAGAPCEFVCEHGVRFVPMLKQFLRVRALAQGYLPFHASAFEWEGMGVLVAGWSHGGKTSSLLAFGAKGARYVGDDLVLVSGDGETMRGLAAPLSLSEWHLGQLPHLNDSVGYGQRLAAAATRRLDAAALSAQKNGDSRLPVFPLRVAAKMAKKKSRVVLPLDEVFPGGSVAVARPRKLFLMMSAEEDRIDVEPVDPATVAERMSHSLAAEALPMLEHYHSYRYAGIGPDNPRIEDMAGQERRLLRAVAEGLDTFVARHPYPVSFARLFTAMRPACESRGAVRAG